MIEGRFKVRLPTIWTDGKAEVERIRQETRREEKRKSENQKLRRSEDHKKGDQRRERVKGKKMQARER